MNMYNVYDNVIYIYIDKSIVSTSSPTFVLLHFCIYSPFIFFQVILTNCLNYNDLITYIISFDRLTN